MGRVLLFISFFLILNLGFSQPKDPPKGEKCVVCGMDVSMDPKFTSQVKLRDGSYKYAESPKHIIQYYLENKDKIVEIWIRDYENGKWIDGKKAFYVVTNKGPMGYDLMAFQSRISAQKFAGKKKVYRFTDINKDFLTHLEMGHEH